VHREAVPRRVLPVLLKRNLPPRSWRYNYEDGDEEEDDNDDDGVEEGGGGEVRGGELRLYTRDGDRVATMRALLAY